MENDGQSELERLRADLQLKRAFVGSILNTFPVCRGKGDFKRDFGTLSRFRVDSSRKGDHIPEWGTGMVTKSAHPNHMCPRWLNGHLNRC